MLILQGADKSDPACLVFEATFDGTRKEFLDDLLRVAPEGIHNIYKNCEDYPGYWFRAVAGLAVPALVKEYLLEHDVGANAFYSGSPGRTVAQIQGEHQIREEITHFISKRRRSISPPTSFLGLQQELQHEVIRKRPRNRWAEQSVEVPLEIARRQNTPKLIQIALLTAAFLIGWLGFLMSGWSFAEIRQTLEDRFQKLNDPHVSLAITVFPELLNNFLRSAIDLAHEYLDKLRLPSHPVLILLVFLWYVWRFLEFVFEYDNPREYGSKTSYFLYLSWILRNALLVLLIAIGVWLMGSLKPPRVA